MRKRSVGKRRTGLLVVERASFLSFVVRLSGTKEDARPIE
jgi:hypothetical protein